MRRRSLGCDSGADRRNQAVLREFEFGQSCLDVLLMAMGDAPAYHAPDVA
jgi:hypothetical protein